MTRLLTTLSLAALSLVPLQAAAQTADHLACYTIKDPLKQSGIIDLDAGLLGVEQGCKIAKRSLRLCGPATKQVVELFDASVRPPAAKLPLEVSGRRLTDLYLCYKVKCPARDIPPFAVSDQFGTRDVEKLRITEVCAPAEPSSCTLAAAPACGGTCPTGAVCASLVGDDGELHCTCDVGR
jgi:hypothetical protein